MAEDSAQLVQFRLMARYNAWSNRNLYKLAGDLTDEERKRDRGAFFHSVHGTLNHLLLTDRHWMHRFALATALRFHSLTGVKLEPVLGAHGRELFADFAELRAERQATDAALEAFTLELEPSMLSAPMRYSNSQGVERAHPLWFAIAHLFNHQTHHRSQATTMPQQLGHDYGVTDFLAMYAIAPESFNNT
ncbi:MAG TPA: DinB family protein [Candidatus Binataceae bacterium]|nr:DinB family protein [Candidatus Binataceae bacterium]